MAWSINGFGTRICGGRGFVKWTNRWRDPADFDGPGNVFYPAGAEEAGSWWSIDLRPPGSDEHGDGSKRRSARHAAVLAHPKCVDRPVDKTSRGDALWALNPRNHPESPSKYRSQCPK